MIRPYLTILTFLCCFSFYAQEYFPKNDGVVATNTNYTAFTNAKIYVTPTQVIENGTLLIKDGKVVATGTSVSIPKNTKIIDVSGKSIYLLLLTSIPTLVSKILNEIQEVDEVHSTNLAGQDITGTTM